MYPGPQTFTVLLLIISEFQKCQFYFRMDFRFIVMISKGLIRYGQTHKVQVQCNQACLSVCLSVRQSTTTRQPHRSQTRKGTPINFQSRHGSNYGSMTTVLMRKIQFDRTIQKYDDRTNTHRRCFCENKCDHAALSLHAKTKHQEIVNL